MYAQLPFYMFTYISILTKNRSFCVYFSELAYIT